MNYPIDQSGMSALLAGAGSDTRAEALETVRDRVGRLQQQCLQALKDAALTVHEVAERIGETVPSTQPRISELVQLGKVVKTTLRRANVSGRSATVWMAK